MISKWEAVIWLAILTIWVSILSGYLVDTIQVIIVSKFNLSDFTIFVFICSINSKKPK